MWHFSLRKDLSLQIQEDLVAATVKLHSRQKHVTSTVWLGFHVGFLAFLWLYLKGYSEHMGRIRTGRSQPCSNIGHLYEWLCPSLYDPLARFPSYLCHVFLPTVAVTCLRLLWQWRVSAYFRGHVFLPTVELHGGCSQTFLDTRLKARTMIVS